MNVPISIEPAGPAPPEADAHGSAALLLVESLIHGLTAGSVLSVAEAVDVMEIARDTQRAVLEDAEAPTPSMHRAVALLEALTESLRVDLPLDERRDGDFTESE